MAIEWNDGVPEDTSETEPAFCVFYAGAKTGKTTLGSEFPDPLYVRTGKGERAPAGVKMKSFGFSETYQEVLDQAEWFLKMEHDRKTYLLDSADGLDKLMRDKVCAEANVKSIEDIPYGKGYPRVAELWQEFVKKMLELKEAGYYVVILSHVRAAKVVGITSEGYLQWAPNLRDDTVGILIDSADLIAFLHPRVSIKKDDLGFKRTHTRAEGGAEIVMEVQGRANFIAGNRYDIEKTPLPFKRGEGFKVLDYYFQRNALAPEDDAANDNAEKKEAA